MFLSKPPATVPKMELARYMGKWYVIAGKLTPFESGATNATESYSWNEAEQRIDIDFQFFKNSPDGPLVKYPQKGWVKDPQINTTWQVQFFWPLKFDYLIVELSDDYQVTVVSSANRNYVWIMARTPTLPESVLNEYQTKLANKGFDLSGLVRVPQNWKN